MLKLNENSKIAPLQEPEIIFFKTDDDFQNFCVLPYTTLGVSEITGEPCQRVNFTKEYLDAVATGKRFKIRNEDSVIYKRGMVTGPGGIGLMVKNLDPWYEGDEE